VPSIPGGGSVVGGPARFARAEVDTDPGEAMVDQAWAGLTPRDLVVLRYLSQGWTTSDIAHQLAYAESTIKKEVHLIVHRLGARNRTHAVATAIRFALI
jgi:DNA-binding NarL/FixJ family response regulator